MPALTRDDVVRAVRGFVGLSAINDPAGELARLVDFPGGPPPEQEVLVKTNCAMFVCGIWRWLGEQTGYVHPLLSHPYVSGMALTWVLEIAREREALHLSHDGHVPQRGDVLHWASRLKPGAKPRNDDHVAFAMTDPDEYRRIIRAGGGGANNAIRESRTLDDYTIDNWRPLAHWIDTKKILSGGRDECLTTNYYSN